MDIYRGIKRRVELFGDFCEGRGLLAGRKIRVFAGPFEQKPFPAVFVTQGLRGIRPGLFEQTVRVQIFDDRSGSLALLYAVAEQLEDYLTGVLDFDRVGMRDARNRSGGLLCLEYLGTMREDGES